MWLTKIAIERPVSCIVVFLAILVLGLRSVGGMLIELNPKVDIPFVGVSTVYPGAGPEEIETLITDPIETAVSSVNLVKNVTSVSRDGVSIVSIEFELEADLNIALSDVRAKVDEAIQKLPKDAEKPVVSKFDISAMYPVPFPLATPSTWRRTRSKTRFRECPVWHRCRPWAAKIERFRWNSTKGASMPTG